MKVSSQIGQTRWMTGDDIATVVQIGKDSFTNPWSKKHWLTLVSQHDCVARVAEHCGRVIGVLAYQFNEKEYRVLHVAVAPPWRGVGVGTELLRPLFEPVDRDIKPMSQDGRVRCTALVPEEDTVTLLFLKANWFRAVQVERRRDGDVVLMRRMFCELKERWHLPDLT